MTIDFEIGKIYDRRRDIHARFGGEQQGGIATSMKISVIFLFTGESGKQYGVTEACQTGWISSRMEAYLRSKARWPLKLARPNVD